MAVSSKTNGTVDCLEFEQVFNALSGCKLILKTDIPNFTTVGVTDAYLERTGMVRRDIIGKSFFEILKRNSKPNELEKLRSSLLKCVNNGAETKVKIISNDSECSLLNGVGMMRCSSVPVVVDGNINISFTK